MNAQIELIIGGRAQGKREAACREHPDHVLLDGGQIELPLWSYGMYSEHSEWREKENAGNDRTESELDRTASGGKDESSGCGGRERGRVVILDHTHLLIRRMLEQNETVCQTKGRGQNPAPKYMTEQTKERYPGVLQWQQDELQKNILDQLMSLTSAGTNTQGKRTVVFVSDEIGCGIVPMDPLERRWREVCGRVLTNLAVRADRVERVTCGIVQILK